MRPSAFVLPLLTFALTAGLPSGISACSCVNISFDIAYASSDAVFLGEVLEVASASPEYAGAVWATIRVEAHWKGAPPHIVRLLTGADGAMCGITFRPGVRYLVYAFSGEGGISWMSPAAGVLWTHLCSRTHGYWAEDPDLVYLGPTPRSERFVLFSPYPNPLRDDLLTIRFDLPVARRVTVHVLDAVGRRVRTLVDTSESSPGLQTIVWDGRGHSGSRLASGIYFVQLRADAHSDTRRVVLVQ